MAFAPNSKDAVVTDAVGNQVYLLLNSNGFFAPSLLAGENAGISRPVQAQFSRDGQQVVVVNSLSRIVQTFALDGTLGSSTPCGNAARLLVRMIGNAVFRITDFDGSSITVFDGDSAPAAAFLIGPLPQADAAASDGLPLARGGAARN